MNQVDQAARRAAERVADKLLPAKFKEEMSQIVSNIIAAEFAPLQERLNAIASIHDPAKFVEAFDAMVRELKTISKGIICHGPGCPYCDADCDHPRTVHAIDAEKLVAQALAAKPTDPPKEAT